MPTLSNNELTLTIRAIDEATATLKKVRDNVDGVSDSSERNTGIIAKLRANWAPIAAVTAAAGVAFSGTMQAMDTTITAANNLQGALTGLSSVARAFGADQNRANQAARDLAKDGLMSVTEAATGLKNLLASKFSLDEAITLMNRFKDSAAFNRQSTLSFGQAVASATEGIKNQNSILVDNAGVTKNLSVILTEAGYSQMDLQKVTTDAGVRQALYNGIIKETNAQVGDAAKLAEQYAGEQAKAGAATLTLQQNIGAAVQQALLPFLKAVTPIITAVSNWVQQNQQLAAAIAIGVTLFLGLAAAVGAVAGIIALVGSTAALVFGSVIALIAAIAAAVIVYWEPITGFINGVFSTIGDIISNVFNWIGDRVTWLKDHFWEAIGFIIGFFATLPIKLPVLVIQAFVAIINWLASINWGQVFAAIGNAFVGAMNWVKDAAVNAWNFIKSINWGDVLAGIGKGIGNAIIGLIEGAINGALSGLPGSPKVKFPRFARGTNYAPGGLALVGEEGPELVNLPRGSQVKTAAETRQALSQAGSGASINVTQHIYNQMDYDKSFAELGFMLRAAR